MQECWIRFERQSTTLTIAGLPIGTEANVKQAVASLQDPSLGKLQPSFDDLKRAIAGALGEGFAAHFRGDPFAFDRVEFG